MKPITLPTFTCQRPTCRHTWFPRNPHPPKVCPMCKSKKWNVPAK